MHKIAVYGTLRKGWWNHRLLAGADPVGSGWTEAKAALMVGAGDVPYAAVQYPVAPVRVEVYEVDDTTLYRLDALEGHPEWYVRTPVRVTLDDGPVVDVEWYIYPAAAHHSWARIESGDYADHSRRS